MVAKIAVQIDGPHSCNPGSLTHGMGTLCGEVLMMCTSGQQVLPSTSLNTPKLGTSCSSPCQRENGWPSLYMKYHRCS